MKIGCEDGVDRTGSGSCPVAGFRISESGSELTFKNRESYK